MGELSPKVTERVRTLTKKSRRSDSIALTKSLPIAAWRLPGDGLALSVGLAPASSPKGGALGRPGHFRLTAESPIWRKRAGAATEGRLVNFLHSA